MYICVEQTSIGFGGSEIDSECMSATLVVVIQLLFATCDIYIVSKWNKLEPSNLGLLFSFTVAAWLTRLSLALCTRAQRRQCSASTQSSSLRPLALANVMAF
jgi:hypothetical protein